MRPLCFSGCMSTSFSISVLHRSYMMKSWSKQPPNCAVCSVSLLSSLQKRQMIFLIDYELEMYPPTQLLVFQDTDSVSLLTLSENKSWNISDVQPCEMYSVNACVPWHSFICYGKYISDHLISGSSCISLCISYRDCPWLFPFSYFMRCSFYEHIKQIILFELVDIPKPG